MASSASGTSSVGTSVLISSADYIIGRFNIDFSTQRTSLPRRVGYYYVLASDLSGSNPVFVLEQGALYIPGIFRQLQLPSPGSTWKMAIVVTWDIGGLPYTVITV
jgi:hypothetical protein